MPLLNTATQMVTNRMPKVISPRTHAIIDYAVAGAFVVAGILLWGRNRRAAVSSFLCAGASFANSAMTDYPGGLSPVYDFNMHGKIDAGLAGLTTGMPTMMVFGDEPEARFFQMMGIAEAAVTGLTDFDSAAGEPLLNRAA